MNAFCVSSKCDVLVIASIERLGRNYDMILKEWTCITKTVGADVVVLDMPLGDTRTQTEDLTGRFIADLVLQILSYAAQKERKNTKSASAKASPPPKSAASSPADLPCCSPTPFPTSCAGTGKKRSPSMKHTPLSIISCILSFSVRYFLQAAERGLTRGRALFRSCNILCFSDSQSISPYGRSLETLTQENSASPSELR